MYPSNLIDREIKKYLNKNFADNTIENRDNKIVCYYKLPFIGSYSNNTKKKISELCKRFCKQTNIKVVFSPFKICDLLSAKDSLPNALKSYVVYKFTCAGCQSCYVGETKRHLPTRMKEHLETVSKSHIFQHLKDNPSCRNVCETSCFKITHHASSPFRSTPHTVVKTCIEQTAEARKYHYFGITLYYLFIFFPFFFFLLRFLIICH